MPTGRVGNTDVGTSVKITANLCVLYITSGRESKLFEVGGHGAIREAATRSP